MTHILTFRTFPGCVDNDPKCDELKENGDCDSKSFLMGQLCPKTCQFCDGSCKDDKSTNYCKQFAREGSCPRDYSEPCKLTCGCDWGKCWSVKLRPVILLSVGQ